MPENPAPGLNELFKPRPVVFVMCERAEDGWYAVTWEDTKLQAHLTMGNLASAFTLQSDEAALVEELRAGSEDAR